MSTTFRKAVEGDETLILSFIKELAEYEHLSDEVIATEELLKEWIFHKNKAEVIFALEDGKEVGFALFFHNFSTFLGRAGIYLEAIALNPQLCLVCSYCFPGFPSPTINQEVDDFLNTI